jgi:ATP-dependent helicase/nuclease subunit B
MPTDLLRGPLGCGKTSHVLHQIRQTAETSPLATIWVLLPGRRQEDAFRERLLEQNRKHYFNITFFNFYTLAHYLLNLMGEPQRALDLSTRQPLIRSLLNDLQPQLQEFGSIAHTPGFGRIIGDFIYELKQNLVEPATYTEVAADGSPKDRDLALIYEQYQTMLKRHELVDREGEGWLALELLTEKDNSQFGTHVSLLVADGFDQFSPLQARLLALVGTRARRTTITLPVLPGRERTVGKRFSEAYQQLRQSHKHYGQPLRDLYLNERGEIVTSMLKGQQDVIRLPVSIAPRQPTLSHLVENSFRIQASTITADESIRLIEAPDPRQEAAAIMRHIKRRIVEGCRPDDVLVAVRDWERYGAHLAQAARDYGIPTALHYGEALGQVPVIQALIGLLELAGQDFPRRAVMDVLRSPYFLVNGLGAADITTLEQISLQQQVIGGRAEWLEAVRQAANPIHDEDGTVEAPLIDAATSQRLQDALSTFFDQVTPPPIAPALDYLRWVENLIDPDVVENPDEDTLSGHNALHLLQQIRASTREDVISRDLSAIHTLKHVLRGVLNAQNLFAVLGLRGADPTWKTFLTDLIHLAQTTPVERNPKRDGRVLVTSVVDARGLSHAHVYVPGLSEGIFPAPIAEDALYLDRERQALTARGVRLETQSERMADEGLFLSIVSLARESVTFSRPTVQNGTIWPESHLWRTIHVLFEGLTTERIALGGIPSPGEAASWHEAGLAIADQLTRGNVTPDAVTLAQTYRHARSVQWAHLLRARTIELDRMGAGKMTAYNGHVVNPTVREWVAEALGPGRVWSASQLNDYGQCGFRFFAKRLLKLEALDEPELGMDSAQQGTLNHAILEAVYQEYAETRLPIDPEHVGLALDMLRRVAPPILRDAPTTLGFRATALWDAEQQTILRKLEKLIRKDFSEEAPARKLSGEQYRYPYRQEAPFAKPGHPVLKLDSLGGLRVQGFIDRIDRAGDRVIIMDYKTGSTKIPTKEISIGRNFQMLLYLRAVEAMLQQESEGPQHIAGGFFWHLSNAEPSGMIDLEKEVDSDMLDKGTDHLREHIQAGREGHFPTHPTKLENAKCSRYCEFSQLCRISTLSAQTTGRQDS